MKKVFSVFIFLFILLMCPFFILDAVEINASDYYRVTKRTSSYIFQDIMYENIKAETRTDMPNGWDQGTGGTKTIDINKWYGQQINILSVPSSSDAMVIPWSKQSGFNWNMMSITEMAKDFEAKHPEYVVLGGVNGDFYDWHNTSDFGQSGLGLEVVGGNMLRYMGAGWDGVGFKNSNSTDEIVFIDGNKVTRTATPILTIFDEDGNELKRIVLDKFNENINDGETGAYFGRVIGDITTNKYGETTYSNRKFQAPTLGDGNIYIVQNAYRVIYQADEGSYYGYGTISSTNKADGVPSTGFAVTTKDPEVIELLNLGTNIRVQYELTGEYAGIDNIIGGCSLLAYDGNLPKYDSDPYLTTRAPRTIAAQKADGTVCLITMDGRQKNRNMYGTNQQEINAFMKSYGITDAVLLDGGGSTTFFIREGDQFVVKNSPSDSGDPNNPRNVGNCLLVVMKRAEFNLTETITTDNSITFKIDTSNVDFNKTTTIKCTLNGQTKEVINNVVTFEGLTSNTEYQYLFTYDTSNKKDIETMVAGSVKSAKKIPTFGELTIEIKGNKLIFNPEIEDPDEALDYYRIFINNTRNPYLGEPIEIKYDTTGLTQIEFDILISYNLNDGKGKIQKTEHVVYKLTNADEPTTPNDPVTPPTDNDNKKGCKKDFTALVVGIISLSTLGVVIKKRENK